MLKTFLVLAICISVPSTAKATDRDNFEVLNIHLGDTEQSVDASLRDLGYTLTRSTIFDCKDKNYKTVTDSHISSKQSNVNFLSLKCYKTYKKSDDKVEIGYLLSKDNMFVNQVEYVFIATVARSKVISRLSAKLGQSTTEDSYSVSWSEVDNLPGDFATLYYRNQDGQARHVIDLNGGSKAIEPFRVRMQEDIRDRLGEDEIEL